MDMVAGLLWRERLRAGMLAVLLTVSSSVVHAVSSIANDQNSIFAKSLYLVDNLSEANNTIIVANQYTRKDGIIYSQSLPLVGDYDDASEDLFALTPSALLLLPGNAKGESYPSDLVIQEKHDDDVITYDYAKYNRESNKTALNSRDVLQKKDLSGLLLADYLNETFNAANASAFTHLKESGLRFPKGSIAYLYQQSVISTTYLDFSLQEATEFKHLDDWLAVNGSEGWKKLQWKGYWIAQPKAADEVWGVIEYQSWVYRALFSSAGDDSAALYKNNYFFNQTAFDAVSEAIKQFYQ